MNVKLLVLGATIIAPLGFGIYQKISDSRNPVAVNVTLDRSAGFAASGDSAVLTVEIAERLRPTDQLALSRFDYELGAFYDSAALTNRADIVGVLAAGLRTPAARPRTRPAVYWTWLANKLENAKLNTVIVVFHDGDNDDENASSDHQIRQAAQQLAKNPRVAAIFIFGLTQKNWARHQSIFAPLGLRFKPFPAASMDSAPIMNALNQARQN